MFYLTLLSAYLVVAFVAGKRLTKFQVWTVSIIYTVCITITALSVSIAGGRAAEMEARIYPDATESVVFPIAGYFILYGGIFMSLLFMWKVRRGGHD